MRPSASLAGPISVPNARGAGRRRVSRPDDPPRAPSASAGTRPRSTGARHATRPPASSTPPARARPTQPVLVAHARGQQPDRWPQRPRVGHGRHPAKCRRQGSERRPQHDPRQLARDRRHPDRPARRRASRRNTPRTCRSRPAAHPRAPRTPGRSAASPRRTRGAALARQRFEPGVVDRDRRFDQRGVDPQRQHRVARRSSPAPDPRWSSLSRRISARPPRVVP